MARTDTFPNFLTDVANAIRSKTGQTETIKPVDFDKAIESISGGGTDEPIVEPDYITDGLVAWWEGCDEVDTRGHWNSRVGDDYIYQTSAQSGNIGANWFNYIKAEDAYRNNMNYSLINTKDYYIQGYTIEVVGKMNTQCNSTNSSSASMGVLCAFNKQASPMIAVCDTKETFGCLNSDATQGLEKAFTSCSKKRYKYAIHLDELPSRSTVNGYLTVLYALNDSKWYQKSRKYVTNMNRNYDNCIVLGYYTGEYLANGEINSIRVYDRKLTEAELLHNYEIDKARFKLDNYIDS